MANPKVGVSIDVTGGDRVVRQLRRMQSDIRSKVIEKATRKGAEIVRKDASNRAPRRTGNLADNIVIRKQKNTDVDEINFGIGPNSQAWYGMFPELGTINHPAKPYLRPALDGNQRDVERTVAIEVRNALGRLART